ncbi:MAG TPA: LLM class F420-dependent oxidoreductase [Candidatus Dormibacteraeota bacterium]
MKAPFFGYHMPNFSFRGVPPEGLFDHVAELALAAEGAGFDLVTVMDHFYQIRGVGPETEPMLEGYVALGALAARTSRIRLGTLVTGVTYRNPALLVKEVTTLDLVSHGRAVFGIGAAWNEDEHVGLGFEFPPIGRRMDRLEEALEIARLMFNEERPSFEGRFYRISRALNVPRPLQPGGPPILIGGTGEKRTLRMVAKYAAMSHWFPAPLEELKRKTGVLEGYCSEVGRDPSEIFKLLGAPVTLVDSERDVEAIRERVSPDRLASAPPMTLEPAAERLRPYLEAGFGGFTFGNTGLDTVERVALAGELKKLLS